MKFFNLVILLLIVTMVSCHRDDYEYDENKTTFFTPVIYEEITSSVVGYVIDENNEPVSGAQVKIYSASTTTNEFGIFVFKNVKMDKQGTFVQVIKEGYFFGSDKLYPNSAATSHSYIKLITDKQDKSFESTVGGIISLTGGGTIDFPANAISGSNGEDYNGTVKLTAQFIDPTSSHIGDIMPGALIGIDFAGSTVALGTAGMFAVEMKGSDGSKLNLKKGMKASFTIPAKTNAKPSSIATWSFDELSGYWKEEGVAKLIGGEYHGEVTHFSFWNCDAPFPVINVCGKVLDQNGNPLNSAQIKVEVVSDINSLYTAFGYTDDNGIFCGLMPKNQLLKITASQLGCNTNGVEVTAGPFDNNVILDDIVINTGSNPLTANILCNGNQISNSILVLKQGTTTVIISGTGNTLDLNLNEYFCSVDNIELFAYNVDDNTSSEAIPYVAGNSTYDIDICAVSCNLVGEFTNICNPITLSVTGGSGSYTYSWSTGANTSSIPSEEMNATVYSVTVIDANDPGCTRIFSKNIPGRTTIKIIAQDCYLPYNLTLEGKNYENVYWSTGEITNNINVNPTVPTTYSVSVTSSDGCVATDEIIVDPASSIFIGTQPVSCNKNFYNLDGNFNGGSLIGENQYYKQLTSAGDLIGLDVLQTGYQLGGYISGNNCELPFEIDLPRYDGLSITNYMSGETISGNVIQYSISGNCYNCQTGGVAIYNINDLNTDLVTQNSNGLPSGNYYVVVSDAQTGCFIAHKKVKIL